MGQVKLRKSEGWRLRSALIGVFCLTGGAVLTAVFAMIVHWIFPGLPWVDIIVIGGPLVFIASYGGLRELFPVFID